MSKIVARPPISTRGDKKCQLVERSAVIQVRNGSTLHRSVDPDNLSDCVGAMQEVFVALGWSRGWTLRVLVAELKRLRWDAEWPM